MNSCQLGTNLGILMSIILFDQVAIRALQWSMHNRLVLIMLIESYSLNYI